MKKKNICFLVGDITKIGGIERVGSIIANNISNLNEKYKVYIFSISKINQEPFFKINDNINIHYLYDTQARYKKDYFNIVHNLRRFIKKNKIDVIIDVDIMLDLFSIPAKFMLNCKLLSWEHFNFNENLGTKLMDMGRKLAAKYSDYIITLTEEDKVEFEKNLKIECPISCIYNPVEMPTKNVNYNLESKTILSVGRLTNQKGFDILVDIAKIVLNEENEWNWNILGEGEDREEIQEKINNNNLQDKVKLLGNVSNVENYYGNSSMFVLTSRYEGLGLVLLEAKSNKLPIVSFNCKSGPSEIIENNENGYLVDCFNVNEMASRILELIRDENLRMNFSSKSYRGLEKFDISNIIKEWEKILDN